MTTKDLATRSDATPEPSEEQPEAKKRGRPSMFAEDFVQEIIERFNEGKTVEQVAEIMEISKTTLYNWRKKHPDFVNAMDDARGLVDDLVEASLFQRARGMTFVDTSDVEIDGKIVSLEHVKHIPPDTAAIKHWLNNRRPEEWRDKSEVDVNNPDGKMKPVVVIMMPDNGRGDSSE